MTELVELKKEMRKLQDQIKKIMQMTKYQSYDDLSAVEYDHTDPDDLQYIDEYRLALDNLSRINHRLSYMDRPVAYTDTLILRPDGRYGTGSDRFYFTSGTVIEFAYIEEVQNADGYEEIPVWTISSVEHNGKDYYIVGYPDVSMDGLKVRVRK